REIAETFGTRTATFSPARLWNARVDRAAVFATAASNDPVVPPEQLVGFAAADPSADTEVVPGAAAGSRAALPWMHSTVNASRAQMRQAELWRWLDRIAPLGRVSVGPDSAVSDVGSGCSVRRTGAGRSGLMLAGDAWQQSSTAGQLIAATRGCSGSGDWQDD